MDMKLLSQFTQLNFFSFPQVENEIGDDLQSAMAAAAPRDEREAAARDCHPHLAPA